MRARGPRALLALLITGGAGALGLGALAASAHAAAAGGCGLNPCAPTAVVNGIDADGTVHVTYTEETPGGLNGFQPGSAVASISWVPPAKLPQGAPVPNPTTADLTNPMCTGTSPMTCSFSFPPTMMVKKFLLNGTYSVTASASDCFLGGLCTSGSSDPTKTLTVANPPSAPGDVKAVAQGSTVKISWTASPEPDVVGYQVLRADGSVACSLSTSPTPTEYACTDTPTKDGSYTYHVVAHRWGPTYSVNVTDQPASPASLPSKAVVVTGTASNTTTTVPGGTGTLGPKGFVPVLTPKKGSTPAVGGPTLRLTPGAGPAVGASTATTADPGFAPTLPYGQPQPSPQDSVATNPSAISAPPAAHKGPASVGTIAVVGAGVLIAVIALHGLWLRAEVRRVPVLEVLDPEH